MTHTILVIDDEPALLLNMLEMLGLEGFEAIGAEDGQTGIQLAGKHRPDLIVCDIRMPEIDGFEVLKILRADPATRSIPVIFLSAQASKEDIQQGIRLGADSYVTKPFIPASLLAEVRARLKPDQTGV